MIRLNPTKYTLILPALCMAATIPSSPGWATEPGSKDVIINLSSNLRPADLAMRGAGRALDVCPHLPDQTAAGAGFISFGLNLLIDEIIEAINRARLAHIASLTDSFAGLRNFAGFAISAAPSTTGSTNCLIVDQIERNEEGTTIRSSFSFKILSYGSTSIALKPLTARVVATTANARVGRRSSQNVNAQMAIAFDALVGGNCAADDSNCMPAERVSLGSPQFVYRNLQPSVTLECITEADVGCGRMSGESAAFPIARAGTPVSVGTVVSLTSVTLDDAKLRQEMWERHRAALSDLLKSAIPDLES